MLKSEKVWLRFTKTRRHDGQTMRFRIQDLPKNLYGQFMDFKLKYYVTQGVAQRAAGVPQSDEAMREYRSELLPNMLEDPTYHVTICCPEDSPTPSIVASSVVKLVTRDDDIYKNISKYKTREMRRYFDILMKWDALYPISNIMDKYKIHRFCEDMGLVVHPDYRGFFLTKDLCQVRKLYCQENDIPMTGGWATVPGTQIGARVMDWMIFYEISFEELGKRVGATFTNVPPTCQYICTAVTKNI